MLYIQTYYEIVLKRGVGEAFKELDTGGIVICHVCSLLLKEEKQWKAIKF